VNPVGLTEVPEGYAARPRQYSRRVRTAAAAALVAFALVGTVTTVVSLGAYCLTSDAANHAALPESYLGHLD